MLTKIAAERVRVTHLEHSNAFGKVARLPCFGVIRWRVAEGWNSIQTLAWLNSLVLDSYRIRTESLARWRPLPQQNALF